MDKSDFISVGRILALTLSAWFLPPRFWRRFALATHGGDQSSRFGSVGERILGSRYSPAEIGELGRKHAGYLRELKMQILGLNGAWRSWRPTIRLNGEDHLRVALERGRGVILWVTETTSSTLIAKMALHNAGHHACQLSRPWHGFSYSTFGVRFLNPIWTRVEDRFIAERLLIYASYGEPAGDDIMCTLRARLSANDVVIITVSALAHKFCEVPFLTARLFVPTGPIRLAETSGAALLPVFTHTNVDGSYDVTIEQPLNPSDAPGDTETVAKRYAMRLEPFVRDHPDQWTGWKFQKFDGAPWLQL